MQTQRPLRSLPTSGTAVPSEQAGSAAMKILADIGGTGWDDFLADGARDDATERRSHRARFERTDPDYLQVPYPPMLFEPAFLAHAEATALRLLDLCLSLPERIFDGNLERMLAFQGRPPEHAALLLPLCTPRFIELAGCFARPDLLVCDGDVQVVELNTATAIGGLGLCDRVRAELADSAYGRWLAGRGVRLESPSLGDVWHDAVLAASRRRERRDPASGPVFFEALVTPSELRKPYCFHEDFLAPIRARGWRVRTGLLQDLTVTADGAFFEGERVDLVYTMFAFGEVIAQRIAPAVFHALARADAAGQVDFIAPPVGSLFDHKSNFELLTSPAYASVFSSQEREFIHRHVPRTWRMCKAVRDEVCNDKDRYVIKPAGAFGGKAVCIGESMDAAAWQAAVDAALASADSHVVQERVRHLWVQRGVEAGVPVARSVCLGPTLFARRHGGTLVRQVLNDGRTPVINGARGAEAGIAFGARARRLAVVGAA